MNQQSLSGLLILYIMIPPISIRLFVLFMVILFSGELKAQLKGWLINTQQEPLALVQIRNVSTQTGTISDDSGYFSVEVKAGDVLSFEHINYETKYLQYDHDIRPDTIVLKARDYSLDEINITSIADPRYYLTNASHINQIPSFLGEQDILKYLATLPGITSLSMLDAGIYVRGGNSSQNAYLINSIPVTDPNHLTGILSTFDPYILGNSRFYKSGYPSVYNGYLSSYINMTPALYSTCKLTGELTTGVLSSSMKFKIKPDKNERSMLGVSYRKSYYQILANAYNNYNDESIPPYRFSDITLSYDYKLSNDWHSNLVLLVTNDDLPIKMGDRFNYSFDWGSVSSCVSVKGPVGASSALNIAVGYNQYASAFNANSRLNSNGEATTRQYSLSSYLTRQINPMNKLIYGLSFQRKDYDYRQSTESKYQEEIANNIGNLFVEYISKLDDHISLTLGLNAPVILNDKPEADLSVRSKVMYSKRDYSLWLDYANTRQYEEKMPVFTVKSPVDINIPVTDGRPASSHHISFGSSVKYGLHSTLNAGLFYKRLQNIKDFSSANRLVFEESITKMIDGKGEAYGAEFDYILKASQFYLRINYTLSEVYHQFKELNQGKPFNPPYDIRHNALINTSYQINRNMTFNALWSYMSGSTITIPIGVAVAKDITAQSMVFVPVYGNRYNYTLPANHRLDVNLELIKYRRKNMIKCNIGVYNLYNQQNPSFVFVEPETKDDYFVQFKLMTKVLLPFMPYLSLTYVFNK